MDDVRFDGAGSVSGRTALVELVRHQFDVPANVNERGVPGSGLDRRVDCYKFHYVPPPEPSKRCLFIAS